MIFLTLFASNIAKIITVLLAFVGAFFYRRSKILATKNLRFQENTKAADKIIAIQDKIIDVVQNTPAVDIDANIERMHNGKL